VRLLTYNIRRGGTGHEPRLVAIIGAVDPDVVVLQEATNPDVVSYIARACSMPVFGSRKGESLAFMTRLPVAEYAWHHPRGSRHAFVEIAISEPGCRVFGVHLSAVHAAWTERRRTRELRALLAAIERHRAGPHVLAGDFNTLAPGELLRVRDLPLRLRPFVWMSGGAIRWRTIREVLDDGYVDAFKSLHPTDGGLTFPTWRPHVRLDYIFLPVTDAPRLRSCEVVTKDPARTASDHFPLLADLAL
jgi:exodeoxyribonuclease-3